LDHSCHFAQLLHFRRLKFPILPELRFNVSIPERGAMRIFVESHPLLARRADNARPASVLPMLAVCLISLFGFVALAVDLGMLAVARTQCQNAADVAALVGARNLNNMDNVTDTNRANALAAARTAAKNNPQLSRFVTDADISSVIAGQYKYDPVSQRFAVSYPGSVASGDSWSAVHVELSTVQPTYFMRVMGVTTMPTGAAATAVHRPRDIAFALDLTGSMGWGSPMNWPYMMGPTEGLMNPDPAYPKFGHYARYSFYQNSTPVTNSNAASVVSSASPASRQNPLQMLVAYSDSAPGTYYPNNHTMTTGGGPPMIGYDQVLVSQGVPVTVSPDPVTGLMESFYTAPGDPSSVNQSTPVRNAFKTWNPTQIAPANTASLTPATFDYSGYNAMAAACPAPDNFDVQSDSPVAYLGDKWPRTDGSLGSQSSAWSNLTGNNFTDNGVYNLKQFLGYTLGVRDLTTYTLSSGGTADTLLTNGNTKDGGDSDANYFDAIWEKYGYDLDVGFLRSQASFVNKTVKVNAGSFQGYSMGPGYWGKTFFIWPPDPRPQFDWRRRFFLRGDGAPFDTQNDNINAILFAAAVGHTLNPIVTSITAGYTASNCPGYYRLNYPAIMAWLKSGPQTLPSNLRSGRILYYSSTPNDLMNGAAGDPNDVMFWREYIHFIFGVGSFDNANAPLSGSTGFTPTYDPTLLLAGVESRFPFGTVSNAPAAQFDPDGSGPIPANPKPYMCYTDNVNRPRMHFWFGPQTMLQFLKCTGEARPWWSGTTRESQCWQLKVAVNSVLDDIRKNHPNDYCGVAGFAYRNKTFPFNTPLAPMGQDWFALKNVLYFRKDTVASMQADSSSPAENRPYTPNFANDTEAIPNGKGSTDPNTGLAVAFNMLSSSPSLLATGNYGIGGRRGAAKLVVFETDGQPNIHKNWSITGSGPDTRYTFSITGNPALWTGDSSLSSHSQAAVQVVQNIVAPVSSTGPSGFSLPNAPARVYAIAFGDVFTGYPNSIGTEGTDALRFLLRVQQVGNTSPSTATSIPAEQVITGPYDVRIANLKSALERLAQSGVQVTLIE
jgi:hypothetical protein